MKHSNKLVAWLLLLTTALWLGGCDGCRKKARDKYFEYLETVGFEKRDMLVNRVDKARDAQAEAQEQFEDALEEFRALVDHTGGELGAQYDKLKGEYDDAESRAEEVRERIRKVENVADSLFDEWQREIDVFENETYARKSRQQMQATRSRYTKVLAAMQQAANSMDPVLDKLRDQVLFLKHNLNAQALGSLDQESEILQADIGRLIVDMQASIAEADRFIAEMTKQSESG